MKKLLIFSILLLSFCGYGQQIFISLSDNSIHSVDASYNTQLITTVPLPAAQIFDIAISGSGQFYGIADNEIIEIDTATGNYNVVAVLPTSPRGLDYTSLTCDNNGNLYTLNGHTETLLRYNISQGTVDVVKHLGMDTPGDLCFYEGNLIYPYWQFIFAYDPVDQSVKKIFCLPDTINLNIWGFSNIFNSCGSERVLAVNKAGELWELDMPSGNYSLLTKFATDTILGMATISEHNSSNCHKSLPAVNCTLSNSKTFSHNTGFKMYPNPFSGQLTIESDRYIQSVKIYTMGGELLLTEKNPPANKFKMNLETLRQGIYMVEIIGEDDARTIKKFVRQ